jgi:hypothetical protein
MTIREVGGWEREGDGGGERGKGMREGEVKDVGNQHI